ncbi:HAD family hydrolase [Longivirga aurantiaca]|uniref:HAD family hydrolase n=1 Tax=Longivirga aurantiaca TaxID=1837743 RepID=A0ABW1T1S9_9ACTN
MTALVLDFGGPVLRTPFELLRGAETRLGLADGALGWTGPFDPSVDEDWRLMQGHAITERDYWQRKADEFAALTGREASFRGLMDVLFDAPEQELVRPEARRLAEDARGAGIPVAVCTNDMQAFHGLEWVQRNEFLKLVDVLVDGSVEHILKPDPRIYLMVVERLGLAAADCVFVDDQPGNVAGAEAVGMPSVWFDVTEPSSSYAEARALLGLGA